MKKNILYLVVFSTVFFTGFSFLNNSIKNQIYNHFFDNISTVAIPIHFPAKYTTFYSSFTNDELSIFRKEMKHISNIKKYVQNASYFGSFKEGFYIIEISQIDNRIDSLLFSTKTMCMIIREKDLTMEKKIGEPRITVYQFSIPQRVVNILKKYEDNVPKDGDLLYNWPLEF